MITEITEREFTERYPDVSTYGCDLFLSNGIAIVCDWEWNGEFYTDTLSGRRFQPIIGTDYFEEV